MLRFILLLLTVAAIGTLAQAAPSPDETPTAPQVRASVERSLGFVQKKGVDWLDTQKCIACHHGAWMVWSLNEAKRAGIATDPRTLDAITTRVAKMFDGQPENLAVKVDHVPSTYMQMSQYDGSSADPAPTPWSKAAIRFIVAGQRPDGSWKYQGQGLDRPAIENDEATTLWALLALPYGPKADAPEAAAREKAMAWLKNVKQGPGLDSLALRLAVEARFGDTARAASLRDELVARQNADGGWKWSEKRASDAFATGESLYVLSLAGVKSGTPAIQKAWKFLLGAQQADGSWLCHTRKPKGGDVIATYWGTAWAVIGLSRSLPPAAPSEATTPAAARAGIAAGESASK